MTSTDPAGSNEHDRAIAMVAVALGDLMEFWNFKPSMGRVWAVLYLSSEPLSAEAICARTGLSSGSVSMTLNELRLWGVVRKSLSVEPGGGRSRKLYEAETDIWAMVTRVFRERELRQVQLTIRTLEEALHLLEAEGGGGDPSSVRERSFIATRLRLLLRLARTGERIIRRLGDAGELDLGPIRDWLGLLQ